MRVNTFKQQALAFIQANPALKRPEYIKAFMEMGMTQNAASIYHYLYVTKARKQVKIAVKQKPQRDPTTGRFMKRAA